MLVISFEFSENNFIFNLTTNPKDRVILLKLKMKEIAFNHFKNKQ